MKTFLRSTKSLAPALLLALGLCLVTACNEPPARELPWQRQDLWMQEGKVEAVPAGFKGRPWNRRLPFLGAAEVRSRRAVPEWHFKAIRSLPASEIRGLEQLAGSRLRWRVQVGQEGYFSFIPLRNETHPEAVGYRVRVRTAEGEQQVHRSTARQRVPPGQAPVYVDLGPWAGQEIDLLLEVLRPAAAPPEARIWALWGSPAVYSRREAAPEPEPGESAPAAATATRERPNVLLIGVDTLRADALGAYGASPAVTPAMDALAAESDVFLDAVSCFNVTNPSFLSLMTGLYGKNHGIYNLNTPLPDEHVTLAELFSAAGYDTLAVIAARHLGPKASGIDQGFDEVSLADRHYAAELGVDMTMDWIATRKAPFFAWLHLFDPHTPHTPPAPYALGFYAHHPTGLAPVRDWALFRNPGLVGYVNRQLGGHRDLYYGEVAYLDRQLDRLLAFLRSRGLLENTLLVFISDHGENLEDHGIQYGHHGLFETTVHVPLMIRWPGAERQGRRLEGLVQNVDVFPTVLAAAGLNVPESDGEDLRTLTADGRRGRRAAFSEHAHQSGARVRTERYSYMRSYGNGFIEDGAYLFDLDEDPGELHNLAGQDHEAEKELEQLLIRFLGQRRQQEKAIPADLTEEEIDRLKALGYLQ